MQTQTTPLVTQNYKLAEAHRLAILAQSDYSKNSQKIESQRLQFLKKYDDGFGQKLLSNVQ